MNDMPCLVNHPEDAVKDACDKLLSHIKPVANHVEDDSAIQRRLIAVKQLISVAHLPLRHLDNLKDKLKANKSPAAWKEAYNHLAAQIGSGFTAAIIGPHGTGKTHMAVKLAVEAAYRDLQILFATSTTFFMDIKATYKQDSAKSEVDVIRTYRKPGLLVLDEVDKRSESDWENRLLFALINHRYEDKTDTVLLSNHNAEQELAASITPAICRRMAESGSIINANWAPIA